MIRSPWSLEEIRRLRELHAQGHGRRYIAHTLGKTRSAVRFRERRLGLMAQPDNDTWKPAEVEQLREMLDLGLQARQIAARLGRKPQSVRTKCMNLEWSLRRDRRHAPRRTPLMHTETWQGICEAAKARGTTPTKLMGRLLDLIISDNLVDSVLDDYASRFGPRMPQFLPAST